MLRWLASLVASSLTFAIADVLCDICIAEHEEDGKVVESAADDEGSADEVEMQPQGSSAGAKREPYAREAEGLLGVTLSRPNAAPRYKQVAGKREADDDDRWSSTQSQVPHDDEPVALTGEQDAAVAGAPRLALCQRQLKPPQ